MGFRREMNYFNTFRNFLQDAEAAKNLKDQGQIEPVEQSQIKPKEMDLRALSPDLIDHAQTIFPNLQLQWDAPNQGEAERTPAQIKSAVEGDSQEGVDQPRFPKLLSGLLQVEGGWRPKVKGDHATMKGITLPTYKDYLKRDDVTEDELKNIPDEDVENIYKRYYEEAGGDKIKDPRVARLLLDQNVNKGTRFLYKLQDAFGHKRSYKLQDETIQALNEQDPESLARTILEKERADYISLAQKDKNKARELPGWLARIDKLYAELGLTPSNERSNYVMLGEPKEQKFEDEPVNIQEMLKKATQDEKQALLFKQMAKARDAAMSFGLGRATASDYGMYDELAKQAQTPLRNLQLKQELENDQAKSDPNSDISMLARKSLEDLGMKMNGLDNVSYAQLEKLYPSLTQALYTKIAAKAKAEILTVEKSEKAKIQQEAQKEKTLKELNRRTEKVLSDKDIVKTYRDTSKTQKLIDNAISNWNNSDSDYKAAAQAGFVSYAKQAQGDDSVLRESDIKVLAGGYNFGNLGSLVSKFAAKASGSDFSPEELKEFSAVIRTIRDIKKKEIQSRLNPILKTAKDQEVDVGQLIDPAFLEDVYSPTIEEKEKRLKELREKSKAKQK